MNAVLTLFLEGQKLPKVAPRIVPDIFLCVTTSTHVNQANVVVTLHPKG